MTARRRNGQVAASKLAKDVATYADIEDSRERGSALVAERRNVHGPWREQANCSQDFKKVIRRYDTETTVISAGKPPKVTRPFLHATQREALEMIAVKMSRILCGDPSEADHWDDIIGYATLGRDKGHNPET